MLNLIEIIERKKEVVKLKKHIDESKIEMKEEFYGTLKQHNLKIYKLQHLYDVNPISDEIEILEKEIEALFMRINVLHKEMRNKYQELQLRLAQAEEKDVLSARKIFKKKMA
jgi:sugar phosphate isomerase/epimerase